MKGSEERAKGTARFAFKSLSKLKENKNKEFTVYLFFTYGYSRLKFSTGLKASFNDWDFKKQRFKNRAHLKEKDANNNKLSKIFDAINDVYYEVSLETTDITPSFLKNRLKLKLSDRKAKTINNQKLTFSELAQKYIDYKEGTIRDVTIRSYKQAKSHLDSFEKHKSKLYELEEINTQFYKEFVEFLEDEMEFTKNTIGKHIKTIKTFMNYAVNEGYTNNQSFKSSDFKVIKEVTTQIYLTEDEIEAFYNFDFSKYPKLELARDIFLMGYYTGQRVSDYNCFRTDDIVEQDGIKFFKIVQKKNRKHGRVIHCPITKEMQNIMDRRHNGQPPKKIPDSDLNEWIKDAGQHMDIPSLNKKVKCKYTKAGKEVIEYEKKYNLIGTHTARRSFATNMYKKGMPVYDIMLFTGHTTEKEFYKYIRIKDEERASHVVKAGYFNV
jgi:integrase